MDQLLIILRDPIWQGVSGVLTFITLMLTFDAPRKYIASLFHISWLHSIKVRIAVVAFFTILFGLFTLQLAVYYGLKTSINVGLGILSLFLLLKLIGQNKRISQLGDKLVQQEKHIITLDESIKRIVSVHMIPFQLDYWEYNGYISETGDDLSEEYQIIRPESGIVYFRKMTYGVIPSTQKIDANQITVEAYNESTSSPLQTSLINDTPSMKTYGILLEPPATPERPFHLKIKVYRQGAWKELFEKFTDTAELNIDCYTKKLRTRYFLPQGLKVKSFTVVPLPIEEKANARIIRVGQTECCDFQASEVSTQRYTYTLYIK